MHKATLELDKRSFKDCYSSEIILLAQAMVVCVTKKTPSIIIETARAFHYFLGLPSSKRSSSSVFLLLARGITHALVIKRHPRAANLGQR